MSFKPKPFQTGPGQNLHSQCRSLKVRFKIPGHTQSIMKSFPSVPELAELESSIEEIMGHVDLLEWHLLLDEEKLTNQNTVCKLRRVTVYSASTYWGYGVAAYGMTIFQSPRNFGQSPSDFHEVSGSEISKFGARKDVIPEPHPTSVPPIYRATSSPQNPYKGAKLSKKMRSSHGSFDLANGQTCTS